MGMFDTYRVAWGDRPDDVQTKQLECLFDCWLIGERVPLHRQSHSFREFSENLHTSVDRSFCSFIDQTNLSNLWTIDQLSRRQVCLSHKNGIFCDYAGFKSIDDAVAYLPLIEHLWTHPHFATSLSFPAEAFLFLRSSCATKSSAFPKSTGSLCSCFGISISANFSRVAIER